MRIYFAAPVVGNSFEIAEQIYNVANIFTAYTDTKGYRVNRGYEVYMPSQLKIPNAWGMTMQEWAHCVFTVDVMKLDKADWVVVLDYGRHNTAGTSWECGYAFGKGKKILVVRMPGVEEQSLMVKCCAASEITYEELMSHKICSDIDFLFTEKGRKGHADVTLN